MCTYKLNNGKNGVELYFNACPSSDVRENLKASGWRWSSFAKCWYNKNTAENVAFAQVMASGEQMPTTENKPFEINLQNLKACVNFEKWQSREWSDVATISRAIKTFMKKAGIKCTVRSQRFSGGDSVDVETQDLKYSTEEKLSTLFNTYFSGGHFDGMNDIYEYASDKNDRPTTKYFFYQNYLSEGLKAEIETYLKNTINGINFDNWQEKNYWINKAHQCDLNDNDCPVFGI